MIAAERQAAQRDNYDMHRADYLRPDQREIPLPPTVDRITVLSWGLVGFGGWVGVETVTGLFKVATCWGVSEWAPTVGCSVATGALYVWTYAGPLGALVAGGFAVRAALQRHRAFTARASLTRDRYSNPVAAKTIAAYTPEQALTMFVSAQQAEIAMAPYKQLPAGLDSLHQTATTKTDAPAQLETPPLDVPTVKDVDTWLPWLTDAMTPHLLLVGKTRAGKSTLADVVLRQRAARGDRICILDPHWSTQDKYGNKKWGGIPPAARNLTEIITVLRALKLEYEDRKRRMALPAGDPEFMYEGGFDPITVLIDEAPEIVAELSANQLLKSLWGETVKVFGSGGAKVNISVILLAQSPNVEDVGMNAKMRANMTTIALANMAKPMIDYAETSRERRQALYALLNAHSDVRKAPAQLPAVAEYGGRVEVLSRDGILEYRQASITAQTWGVAPQQLRTAARDDGALLEMLLGNVGNARAGAPKQAADGGAVPGVPAVPIVPAVPATRDDLIRMYMRRGWTRNAAHNVIGGNQGAFSADWNRIQSEEDAR